MPERWYLLQGLPLGFVHTELLTIESALADIVKNGYLTHLLALLSLAAQCEQTLTTKTTY